MNPGWQVRALAARGRVTPQLRETKLTRPLSPLLPVAKALNIPMLDFDVYAEALDSDRVAAELVPAVVSWLCAVLPGDDDGAGSGSAVPPPLKVR